jgi:hypothetical protein
VLALTILLLTGVGMRQILAALSVVIEALEIEDTCIEQVLKQVQDVGEV